MNRTFVLLGLATALALCAGPAETLADIKDGGTSCMVRYHIRTEQYTVSDHSSFDNVPAGDITMKKDCFGPVIGTFSAHLTANMHLHELTADCLSSGGFTGGCTAGQRILARPAHTLLQSNGVSEITFPVETVRWMWDAMPPGRWRFRLYPASFTPVSVNYSNFTVEALRSGTP